MFYQVLPSFTGFYWVLHGFTGFYWYFWVSMGFTGFDKVLPGFKKCLTQLFDSLRALRPWLRIESTRTSPCNLINFNYLERLFFRAKLVMESSWTFNFSKLVFYWVSPILSTQLSTGTFNELIFTEFFFCLLGFAASCCRSGAVSLDCVLFFVFCSVL